MCVNSISFDFLRLRFYVVSLLLISVRLCVLIQLCRKHRLPFKSFFSFFSRIRIVLLPILESFTSEYCLIINRCFGLFLLLIMHIKRFRSQIFTESVIVCGWPCDSYEFRSIHDSRKHYFNYITNTHIHTLRRFAHKWPVCIARINRMIS